MGRTGPREGQGLESPTDFLSIPSKRGTLRFQARPQGLWSKLLSLLSHKMGFLLPIRRTLASLTP